MEKGKVQTEKVQKEKIKKEKAQKGKMENGISWLIQTGLSLYLILLGVILPFYYGGSYENLGSLKTVFYLRAGGVLAAAALLAVFLQAVKMKKHFLARNFESEKIGREQKIWYLLLFACGVSVFLSFCFSQYQEQALFGASGWCMGLVPQLLMLTAAWLYAAFWKTEEEIWWIILAGAGASSALVCLEKLTALFRPGFALFPGQGSAGESFVGMVGNTNWFCGYLSVFFPLAVGTALLFWKKWREGRDKKSAGKTVFAAVLAFIMAAAGFLQPSSGWYLIFIATAAGVLFQVLIHKGRAGKRGKWILRFSITGIVLFSMQVITGYRIFSDDFGNGRGGIWKMASDCFLAEDWKHKLFGCGPDAFLPWIYGQHGEEKLLQEQYQQIFLANAHQELLNLLLTVGLLGCVLFVVLSVYTLVKRADLFLPLGLAAFVYLIYHMVSFQQVLSTPFYFIVLGFMWNKGFESSEILLKK